MVASYTSMASTPPISLSQMETVPRAPRHASLKAPSQDFGRYCYIKLERDSEERQVVYPRVVPTLLHFQRPPLPAAIALPGIFSA